MDAITGIIAAIVGVAVGAGAVFAFRAVASSKRAREATDAAVGIVQRGESEAKRLLDQAQDDVRGTRREVEDEIRERRREAQRIESRLANREETLDKREETLDKRQESTAQRELRLADLERELASMGTRAEELVRQRVEALEQVAGLTASEARDEIMQQAEGAMGHDLAKRYYNLEQQMLADADEKGRMAISLSIQRLASQVVSETTTSLVPLPNDEMKGRLIGREGRNIRAIEAATGVDLIIDDTPEAITISCFDPIRREVARLALTSLISDGRIHPARVEEAVEKAQSEVDEVIRRSGDQAVLDAGVRGLHPELIKIIGRLKFRYSYGENILLHSVEVARIAGMLAGEIGADIQVAKAGGLLHDIGKALTHEVEGSHIEIGDEIARRYNLPEPVKVAISEHHDDARGTPEAFIVAAADAISAARPGARRDTVEFYLKRLEALEDVANSFPGVQKSFAIQAGREVRILVAPEEVDDVEAASLARNVVRKIEENLVYPGEIKVTVVRETRATETAK